MKPSVTLLCIALLSMLGASGCENASTPFSGSTSISDDISLVSMPLVAQQMPAPPGLVTVALGSNTLEFWPFTGENFAGQGQDPINLVFFGKADPRSIREALMSLDGNRSAFGWPAAAPFNSVWQDAIGNVQTGYESETGWTGGAIQLACGDYHSARFHIRLFRVGDWTIGNAHFEALIPGTSDHQVLSWEFAEQFVMTDMMRTGLLDGTTPIVPTQAINPSPFRTIPAVIYNGLPVDLRAAIGGPLGDVTDDVPIGTDGHAPIFNVATYKPWQAGSVTESSVSMYDQVIPKPFCAGQDEYVHVYGPVTLNQVNEMTSLGEFISTFRAEGELLVTPIDVSTGQPSGESKRAIVREHHDTYLSDAAVRASSMQHQTIIPPSDDDGGSLLVRLRVNSNGANAYQVLIRCGDDPVAETSETMDKSLLEASPAK